MIFFKLKISQIFFFSIFLFLSSCSGYRFKTLDNPFEQYHIQTLSIPLFQNTSSIPNVSGPFTRELINSLMRYPNLKVYSGDWKKCDAILIGIVESPQYIRSTLTPGGVQLVSSQGRKDWKAPTATTINLRVRLLLIKDPTQYDLDYFLSSFSQYSFKHPKLIYNESFGLSFSFNRRIDGGVGNEGGSAVNFSSNKGQERYGINEMAKTLAENFREKVLYAY